MKSPLLPLKLMVSLWISFKNNEIIVLEIKKYKKAKYDKFVLQGIGVTQFYFFLFFKFSEFHYFQIVDGYMEF
jgi:hypothetical protein